MPYTFSQERYVSAYANMQCTINTCIRMHIGFIIHCVMSGTDIAIHNSNRKGTISHVGLILTTIQK